MNDLTNTAGRYLPAGGEIVVVPGRVAAWLNRYAGLEDIRVKTTIADPEVRGVLLALAVAERTWLKKETGLVRPAPEPAQWLHTAQAADLLRITPRGVRKACAEGRLKAELINGNWLIPRDAVAHYRAARRQI